MKKLLFFTFALLITFVSSATSQNYYDESDPVYIDVEQKPEFPGGDKELFKYVQATIKYPTEAYEQKIEGRVIVQFVVEKDGSISDVKVVRKIHPLLDAEAVRVIENMPKWEPGTQRGKIVRVRYILPISFKI